MQPDVQNLNQNQNFTDLSWYDSQKIILANDKGEVILFKSGFHYLQIGFEIVHRKWSESEKHGNSLCALF